jgi:hypothetical protein
MTYRKQAAGGPASFWEIFQHSWQVLWERPGPFLVAILALALASIAVDKIADAVLGPFGAVLSQAMSGENDLAFLEREIRSLARQAGYLPLAAGLAIPWLLGPFTNLALARLAQNLWDGYQAGARDLAFAAKGYPAALYVTVLTTLLGLALGFMAALAWLPMAILHSLGRAQGLPTPVFLALSLVGLAVGLALFINFVWPFLRRYAVLQFLAFFGMAEGQEGPWRARLAHTFAGLKAFPRHLNQAVFVMVVQFLAFTVALSVVSALFSLARTPPVAGALVVQFLALLGISWFVVALAGFYRLCLDPAFQGPGAYGEPQG